MLLKRALAWPLKRVALNRAAWCQSPRHQAASLCRCLAVRSKSGFFPSLAVHTLERRSHGLRLRLKLTPIALAATLKASSLSGSRSQVHNLRLYRGLRSLLTDVVTHMNRRQARRTGESGSGDAAFASIYWMSCALRSMTRALRAGQAATRLVFGSSGCPPTSNSRPPIPIAMDVQVGE